MTVGQGGLTMLRAGKPGDLPVEEPMRFEVVIAFKAVKAIGVTIIQSVLFRADQVIQ